MLSQELKNNLSDMKNCDQEDKNENNEKVFVTKIYCRKLKI